MRGLEKLLLIKTIFKITATYFSVELVEFKLPYEKECYEHDIAFRRLPLHSLLERSERIKRIQRRHCIHIQVF